MARRLGVDMESVASSFQPDALFSDVTLLCRDRSFACHKVVLAARSDVFRAMLSHEDMEEALTKKVKIIDIEPEILEMMLLFLYTDDVRAKDTNNGETPMSVPVLCNLLAAADKYNVAHLRDICEGMILRKVDVLTAVRAIAISHLHGSDYFQEKMFDFVIGNIDQISKMPDWNEIQAGPGVYRDINAKVMKTLIEMLTKANIKA